MDYEDQSSRVEALLARKPTRPRAVVITGRNSLRTIPADSALSDAIVRRTGFVGVYDGRISGADLLADLIYAYAQMYPEVRA